MRFLYQKIQLLAGSAFATLQRHVAAHPHTDSFRLPQRAEVVESFLRCIEQELLSQEHTAIAAKAYFQHASGAIDELLALVDTALTQLQPGRN